MSELDKHCEECGQDTTMRGFVNRIPGDQGGYICGPCVSEFYGTWECETCGEPIDPEHPEGEPHCINQEHDSREGER
jgi:hypothetical protein